MVTSKLFLNGNTLVMSLPKEIQAITGWKPGDHVGIYIEQVTGYAPNQVLCARLLKKKEAPRAPKRK